MAGIDIKDSFFRRHRAGDYDVHYEISDEDSANDTKYYGYLSYTGDWVIMKWDSTAGTYRYAAGNTLYSANWTARAGLSYGYFNNL